MARASEAAQDGNLEDAIDEWTKADAAYLRANDPGGRIEALLRRAEAYARRGFVPEAVSDLGMCRQISADAGIDGRAAEIDGALGSILMHSDQRAAERFLTLSLARAVALQRWSVAASAANNLGNLLALEQEQDSARRNFDKAVDYATRAGRPLTAATAGINAARLEERSGETEQVETRLDRVREILLAAPPSATRTRLLMAQATILLGLLEDGKPGDPARRYHIFRSLSLAAEDADKAGDRGDYAQARGYLGHLYELEGRPEEALTLTQQAIFAAQQAGQEGQLYPWQWQAGRILAGLGERDRAIGEYRRAVADLQSVRGDLLRHQEPDNRGFRQETGRVFFELTDLLLRRAAEIDNAEVAQRTLEEARQTVELFKAAELEDYFQDNCVATLRGKATTIDQLAKGTAAIYPIPLADRLAIILSVGGHLQLFSVPVTSQEIEQQAIAMRSNFQRNFSGEGYLRPAEALYGWLIAPILQKLEREEVDTLVVAPDGILRTIPFAALYDGRGFLVEQFAVAVVPGLTLLDPAPLPRKDIEIFVNALSESVQGFSALPSVPDEVRNISSIFDINLLLNETYLVANVEREFSKQAYTIVHVASHGQFSSDARESFVLAYDGKITMDRLEDFIKRGRFSDRPVELLTLSACQTAVGDDRAALGLAGAAIKAGARSVMGSLWLLSDEATTELVGDFYRNLGSTAQSKAKALQGAQLALLHDPRYAHPYFWSPFLMIGNWL